VEALPATLASLGQAREVDAGCSIPCPWDALAWYGNPGPTPPSGNQGTTVHFAPPTTSGPAYLASDLSAARPSRGWWLNQTSPAFSAPGRRMGGAPFSPHDPPLSI